MPECFTFIPHRVRLQHQDVHESMMIVMTFVPEMSKMFLMIAMAMTPTTMSFQDCDVFLSGMFMTFFANFCAVLDVLDIYDVCDIHDILASFFEDQN